MSNTPERILVIKTACERILQNRLGSKIHLELNDEMASSPRSSVVRFHLLEQGPNWPTKLIAKQANHDATASLDENKFGFRQRFFNEWAALQFLDQIFGANSPAPKFYGGDKPLGIVLMEDLGQGDTLITSLSGSDPKVAEGALIEHMAMLGRLHAATVGTSELYDHLRRELGPVSAYFSPAAEDIFPPDQIIASFHRTLQLLDLEPAPGFAADLAAIVAFWAEPGPFLVYTHGDPAPGNECKVGDKRRLIDFEFGGFRHALTEGVYARMQFVTGDYVLSIPDPVSRQMEDGYRAELIKGCPEAANDQVFYQALTEACAYVTIAMWHWAFPHILTQDEAWGVSSYRQRLLKRLDILTQTAATVGHLEAVGATAHSIAKKLRARWSTEVGFMPYYPAFR